MQSAVLPVLFVVLFCSVLVWFVLVHRLFESLKERHPAAYDSLGRPTLFLNNSIQNNRSFLRFLLRREFEPLNDERLSRLCRVMVVMHWSYLALFAIMVLLVFMGGENNG